MIMMIFMVVAFLWLLNTKTSAEVVLAVVLVSSVVLWLKLLKNWNHVILILMTMELLMMCAFFTFTFNLISFICMSHLFLFSTMMVIEASAGMSILTLISRSHGNDFMLIF